MTGRGDLLTDCILNFQLFLKLRTAVVRLSLDTAEKHTIMLFQGKVQSAQKQSKSKDPVVMKTKLRDTATSNAVHFLE
jgi:hypothetical protein